MTTIKTVVNTHPALLALGELKFKKTSLGFKLATYTRLVGEHNRTFEAQRLELLKEHGTSKDDGRTYSIPNEKVKEFSEALEDMHHVEVDGLTAPEIKLSDLRDGTKIKAASLFPLYGTVLTADVAPTRKDLTFKRNEFLMMGNAAHALGSVDLDVATATKVLALLSAVSPIIEEFQKEESKITGTPEEVGAALKALYDTEAEYSLPTITLIELEDVELEPNILMNLGAVLDA